MTPPPNVPPVFLRIAKFVPEESRARYWQFVALICKISPDDDVLLLVEAIGFMTQIMATIPSEMATERKDLEALIDNATKRLEGLTAEIYLASLRGTRLLRKAIRIERNRVDRALQEDVRKIEFKRQELIADQEVFFERIDERMKKFGIGAGVVWILSLVIVYLIASSQVR